MSGGTVFLLRLHNPPPNRRRVFSPSTIRTSAIQLNSFFECLTYLFFFSSPFKVSSCLLVFFVFLSFRSSSVLPRNVLFCSAFLPCLPLQQLPRHIPHTNSVSAILTIIITIIIIIIIIIQLLLISQIRHIPLLPLPPMPLV